jgi:hypothetical protein
MRYFAVLCTLLLLAALTLSGCAGMESPDTEEAGPPPSKTSPFNDCDGDGVPDRTDDDDDNDGFADWLEIQEGTDPCDPFDRPELEEKE